MNKSIIIVTVIVILLGISIYFLMSDSSSEDVVEKNSNEVKNIELVNDKLPTNVTANTDSTIVNEETYSVNEVAIHDLPVDCWMIIDKKVYDVSEYTSSHPGGASIAQGCGIDATGLFENRPNGSGSHSDNAQEIKDNYFIGKLE